MKKLFNFRLLVLIGVLIMSVSQMWASGTSVTFYTYGAYFTASGGWDYSSSTMKISIRLEGLTWTSDVAMTKTDKTYLGFPIYSYTFTEKYGGAEIWLKNFVGGTQREEYKPHTGDWISADDINGKMYLGYVAGKHAWVNYSTTTFYPIYLDLAQFTDGDNNWTSGEAKFYMTVGASRNSSTEVGGVWIKDKLYAFSCTTANPTTLTFTRHKGDDITTVWNTAANITYNSSYNAYKITGWNAGTCAEDNINLVNKTTRVYFDNSMLEMSDDETYKYFVIGHDNFSAYSKVYQRTAEISNTKLLYYELSTDVWRDATYYGFIGSGEEWNTGNDWGSSNLKNATKFTKPYKSQFDLKEGEISLFKTTTADNDQILSVDDKGTVSSGLNTTQTIKYALATGGTAAASASEMTSGTTPATVTISSYKFTNGTYNSVGVSSSPAKNMAAGGTTRSMTENAAYTATTTVTVSSVNAAYSFKGFFENASGGSALDDGNGNSNDYVYYPKGNKTIFARFVSLYSVSYDINGGTGTLPTKGAGTHESGVNVTLGNNNNSDGNGNIYKTGYTLTGWNTEDGGGGTHYDLGATISAIGANKTLYAEWTEDTHDVSVAYKYNGESIKSSGTVSGVGIATSQSVTAPDIDGYVFTGWSAMPSGVTTSGELTDKTISINATADDKTITANYTTRYALEGSLYDDSSSAGMPGWVHGDAADFTVVGFTGLDELGVNLRCTLNTIHPNKKYKFRVYDRAKETRLGATSADYELAANASVQLFVEGEDPANNVVIYTVGYGTYIFHITNISSTNYYPTIEVIRQASSQLTLGWKHYTNGELSDGNTGGTVTAATNEGSGFAITNGQFYANGSNLTFTAVPATGYHVEGWYSDASCSSAYTSGEGGATISGAGNVTLTLSSVSTNKTVYVKFAEDTNTFSAASGSNWNTIANWSAGHVPAITDVVYITAPVTVDIANAKAKRVYIDQSSTKTGKLTVGAGKALVVAATIQKINSSSEIVATEETDIVLESDDSNGTGALVAGSASTTTKATVHFYSKAKKDGSDNYINQYFGTPMDSVSKLNYYGSYLQKYDQPTDSWVSFTSEDKLGPWTAYRIMRSETTEGTYQIGGTLLLPGIGDGKTKTLTLNTSSYANDNMFANSWAAPIDITKLDTENDFDGATATIYIFNAGSAADYSTNGGSTTHKGARAGQWIELPVSATMAVPTDYDLNVIPSQQAFLVQATSGDGAHSLKLDYKKLVYDPIVANGATITPTRAPRHEQANDLEIVRLFMTGESGLGDRVLMYVRDDFSAEALDNGWEAYKLPGSAFAPQLCAYSGLGEMSISATNVVEGTVLGFYAGTEDSEYTFTFDYEGDKVWYLNDLEAQQSTLIDAEHSYEFSAVPGTVAEHRFVISHTPIAHVPTGIDNSAAIEGVKARKQVINGILYIIRGGQIYSTDGQIVK